MNEGLAMLLIIPLFLIAMALYMSPWWVRQLWPRVRYCMAKKETVRAKLLELEAKHPLRMRDGGWFSACDEDVFHTHYAIFKAADGHQYTMVITKNQYQGMIQGTTGILTRQGNRFISFETEK